MANDDHTGLSIEDAPTAAEVALVDGEIDRFHNAEPDIEYVLVHDLEE